MHAALPQVLTWGVFEGNIGGCLHQVWKLRQCFIDLCLSLQIPVCGLPL